jgi:hypothetical protein
LIITTITTRKRLEEEPMSQGQFKVKPVRSYEEAHYFAAPADEPAERAADERPHPLTLTLLLLLILGIGVGLIGCYMRTDLTPDPPEPDGGPDGDPPDPPICDEGALRCADDWTLEICNDDAWHAQSCHEICNEDDPWGYSNGCNAEADDPCQCEYDMIAGVQVECYPEDVYCVDERQVYTCEDYSPVIMDCDDWCVEQYGPDYASEGCDGTAEEPCQCFYNILEGDPIWCAPGDVICLDEETLGVCENEDYVAFDCDERCQETYGPDAHSAGCDATAEDPCLCIAAGSGSGEE